jgi:hypothetical protein
MRTWQSVLRLRQHGEALLSCAETGRFPGGFALWALHAERMGQTPAPFAPLGCLTPYHNRIATHAENFITISAQ